MWSQDVTNPSLNTGKGNISNFRKPTSPYKATTPSNKGSNAIQKVCAIMAELDDKDLEEARTAFIECLDDDKESVEEETQDF